MPVDLQETRLPGIGTKFTIRLDAGARLAVIAILREPEPVTGAQPDDVIQKGDTLVTVGKAGQYAAFRRMLAGGEPST